MDAPTLISSASVSLLQPNSLSTDLGQEPNRPLQVVPPIVVKDELDTGVLVEIAELPELAETFFAITLSRRFPNPLLNLVLPKDSL